ncbi:MAG: GntR family transcriptional regulator [Lactobacillus sp.]|jgi:DNA-binding transcriptional regulator YhcF (GntR family)|nr:GntR family transcriptional regulator [Lactobacillus sp.]
MKKSLYQIIIDDLSQAITSGQLPVNAKVPTEQELAKQYQVSRITSKRALNDLEQAGLIYRKQGSGSFVAEQQPDAARTTAMLAKPLIYCVLPDSDSALNNTLVTQLLLAFGTLKLSATIILPETLTDLLPQLTPQTYLILLGDRFQDDLIYQLYEMDIPYFKVGTSPNALDYPQITLSSELALQNMLNDLDSAVQQLIYVQATPPLAPYSDATLKIDLLKAVKQHQAIAKFKLQLTSANRFEPAALPAATKLIVSDFDLLLTLLTSSLDPNNLYFIAPSLTEKQAQFVQAQHIHSYACPLSEVLTNCQKLLGAIQKDATINQNLIVNAQLLS